MNYTDFLASKRIVAPSTGIEVDRDSLHPSLFEFQKDLVTWALRKGRAAIFSDTGTGKTRVQLQWAHSIGKPTLILTPLAVAQQTVAEAEALGIAAAYVRDHSEIDPVRRIHVSNYERVDRFDPSQFDAVVLDECFAPDTEIDTPAGPRPINSVAPGDYIENASGIDVVVNVHRREVPYAIRVTVAGHPTICSPNHPWFTQRGWIGAQDLHPGDAALQTVEAMRMVREGVHPEVLGRRQAEVLRSVLLSEMAHEPTGACGESPHPRGGEEARREAPSVALVGAPESRGRAGAYSQSEPHNPPRGSGENLPPIERDRPQTFRAWGPRSWFDQASEDHAGCTRTDLGSGVCFITGTTDSRLPHALQARLGESRSQDRYRGGWQLPLLTEARRPEEGCQAGFARVDGIEVLEPEHPDLERYRDAAGALYFYDIGATRHPSFSVAGCLVHNSSILKAFSGVTKKALVEAFCDVRYRLCCTATPAPNDTVELCNHADFLGVMSPADMLSTFFISKGKDQKSSRFRLKRHARDAFYRWLASWSMSLKKPSDLGYPDDGFDLPPLKILPRFIEAAWAPEGQLFATGLSGVTHRAEVRRATLEDRVKAGAELVDAELKEQWLVWCGLNDEANLLCKHLPNAENVQGSDSAERKAEVLGAFARGEVKILVTKPSLAGFGMNFQTCARMVFVGLGDSYEQYYQAIRRCWRFGQTRPVHAHIVLSNVEKAIYDNVLEKEAKAREMSQRLVANVREFERGELASARNRKDYEFTQDLEVPAWLESA